MGNSEIFDVVRFISTKNQGRMSYFVTADTYVSNKRYRKSVSDGFNFLCLLRKGLLFYRGVRFLSDAGGGW